MNETDFRRGFFLGVVLGAVVASLAVIIFGVYP